MSAFCEDESRWDAYFEPLVHPVTTDALPLRVFEWYNDANVHPSEVSISTQGAVNTLINRDQTFNSTALRVVAAPMDATSIAELQALKSLFLHYSIPSAALAERIQSVAHSFGAQESVTDPEVHVAWSHSLYKDLNIIQAHPETGEPTIVDMRKDPYFVQTSSDNGPEDISQADSSWRISSTHLHVRTRSDGSKCVTLLLFGAIRSLIERFQRLLANPAWRDVINEPFLLFIIVEEDLYNHIDDLAWGLADVFRGKEQWTLRRAGRRTKDNEKVPNGRHETEAVDFTGLHNISKHCTYLNEAVEASLCTLETMLVHISQVQRHALSPPTRLQTAVLSSLMYRQNAFRSTQLRLRSLEKRMANVISLSFNLVTQQDSRIMQDDSNAMKAIAVLTLIFLPATGISSIFSMPFFELEGGKAGRKVLRVAQSFWIFCVIAVPMTGILFGAWFMWYRAARRKRLGQKRDRQWKKTGKSPVEIELASWVRR
ncbi:unnamed protein product [Zymoseptoria tritici ST99CH_3D1]|nr:unnamed protein product [Zymoseptoria tritici ST99CH_3D1]